MSMYNDARGLHSKKPTGTGQGVRIQRAPPATHYSHQKDLVKNRKPTNSKPSKPIPNKNEEDKK